MAVERAASGSSLIDVLDRVHDKGIVTDTAKLELLEGFLNRSDVADCTKFSLQWLAEYTGVTQSLCLARREGETTLTPVGSYGLRQSTLGNFAISIEDWRHPLIQILAN